MKPSNAIRLLTSMSLFLLLFTSVSCEQIKTAALKQAKVAGGEFRAACFQIATSPECSMEENAEDVILFPESAKGFCLVFL